MIVPFGINELERYLSEDIVADDKRLLPDEYYFISSFCLMYNKSLFYESITGSEILCRKMHENGTAEYFQGDKLYVKKQPSLISFQTYLYDSATESYVPDTIHFNFYDKIIFFY